MKIEIEKPVIPKFVADWIESLCDEGGNKYDAILIMFEYRAIYYKPVLDWFIDNKDTFINAVMHGYEIEQEPLYYAKVKGSELIRHDFNKPYWTLEIDDLFISFNGDIDNDEYHTRMTKEEWNKLGINSINADFEEVR